MQTEKLLKLLKENKVKFVIIGATAISVKPKSRQKAIATDFALGGALILFSDD